MFLMANRHCRHDLHGNLTAISDLPARAGRRPEHSALPGAGTLDMERALRIHRIEGNHPGARQPPPPSAPRVHALLEKTVWLVT